MSGSVGGMDATLRVLAMHAEIVRSEVNHVRVGYADPDSDGKLVAPTQSSVSKRLERADDSATAGVELLTMALKFAEGPDVAASAVLLNFWDTNVVDGVANLQSRSSSHGTERWKQDAGHVERAATRATALDPGLTRTPQ